MLALPSWAPQSQPLVKALTSRIRSHNLQLVTRSYTTISAPKLAMMLGTPQAEVAQGKQPAWTHVLAMPPLQPQLLDRAGVHVC